MTALIRRYKIIGARTLSNYCWTILIFIASLFFVITGISSLFINLSIDFLQNSDFIQFWPQGLVMSFYGVLGLIFSSYLALMIIWSVGGGFNEFNGIDKKIRIFRWGFPGKNRRINLVYNFDEVEGIRLELTQGFNEKKKLYLQLSRNRAIPLTRIGESLTYAELEKQAAELAKFLHVSLYLN